MDLADKPNVSVGEIDPEVDSLPKPNADSIASEETTKVEVASTVAAITAGAAKPSTGSEEALELFRSSLLGMVGVPEIYLQTDAKTAKKWLPLSTPAADETCASLIAKYVSLWSVLERPENQKYSIQALIGLRMFQAGNAKAASKVFDEIEFHTSTPAALSYVMRGIRTILLFFFTALLLIVVTPVYLDTLSGDDQSNSLGQTLGSMDLDLRNVVAASIAGLFGSVVSLLLRLSEFEATKGRSRMFLTMTGISLPIVGAIFGAFVAALFSAKVVNVSLGEGGFGIWAFVAIGFLAGFSERFSRGFVQMAEKRLGGSEDVQPMSVAAAQTTVTKTERRPRSRKTEGGQTNGSVKRNRPARSADGA